MAEMYRAGEVTARLGIRPSTLRLYSVRFAAWLSPGAASPGAGGGRKGHRSYTDDDLATLARVKGLLTSGRTVAEVQTALGEPRRESRIVRRDGGETPRPATNKRTALTLRQPTVGERSGDGPGEDGSARARVVASEEEAVAPGALGAARAETQRAEATEQVIAVVLQALADSQHGEALWRRLLERRRHEAEWLRVEVLRQEVELARLSARLNERMRVVLRRVEQLAEPVRALLLEQSEHERRRTSRKR